MTKKANKQLLQAVLEPRKPGAIQQIADACAAGANPNGICPETSSSSGHVRGGSTLLTYAVEEGASRVVEKLLECGADPSLVDDNGWTPWMASTLTDEDKQGRIQELLSEHKASQDGEHIGQLARAVAAGDIEQASSLIESQQDLEILANFRVDLVRHQIINGNTPMLEFLLQNNMTPDSAHLTSAVKASNLSAVDVLLRNGLPPESKEDNETLLMMAAGMGELAIVQRLVEAGADVNRYADNNVEWTAAFLARQAGHAEVADWLTSQMGEALLEEQQQAAEGRDPRFRLLYDNATAGEGLPTDNIVAALTQWHEHYGIEVRNASGDSVTLEFSSVPDDLDDFFEEVQGLCPEVSEDESNYKNELVKKKTLTLWWD